MLLKPLELSQIRFTISCFALLRVMVLPDSHNLFRLPSYWVNCRLGDDNEHFNYMLHSSNGVEHRCLSFSREINWTVKHSLSQKVYSANQTLWPPSNLYSINAIFDWKWAPCKDYDKQWINTKRDSKNFLRRDLDRVVIR